MLNYIFSMGPIGLLNSIILFFIALFALRNIWILYVSKKPANLVRLGRSINNMLFWGGIIITLAFLGTFLGMKSVFEAIGMSGTGDTRILMGGFAQLLLLPIFSLNAVLIVILAWYVLSNRHRKLMERSTKEMYADN